MGNGFQRAVGERIRQIRVARGISQLTFSEAANLNPALASRIERGLQNMTLTLVARVALALGVPVAAIFENIQPGTDVLETRPRRNARSIRVDPSGVGPATDAAASPVPDQAAVSGPIGSARGSTLRRPKPAA